VQLSPVVCVSLFTCFPVERDLCHQVLSLFIKTPMIPKLDTLLKIKSPIKPLLSYYYYYHCFNVGKHFRVMR